MATGVYVAVSISDGSVLQVTSWVTTDRIMRIGILPTYIHSSTAQSGSRMDFLLGSRLALLGGEYANQCATAGYWITR